MTPKLSRLGRIAAGIQIVLKYEKDADGDMTAEHDQVWIGAGVEVSKEDEKTLRELGWFPDVESWSHFV